MNTDEWWRSPSGWQEFGVHTPMRRCGVCKVDIVSDSWADKARGLCGQCCKSAPAQPVKRVAAVSEYEGLDDDY
mgnify:CR=1 FL=1